MMNLKTVTALWVLLVALVSIGIAAPAGIDVKVGFTGPDGQGSLRTEQSDGTLIQVITPAGVITQANIAVTGTALFQSGATIEGTGSFSNGTFSGTMNVTGPTTLDGATVIDDTLNTTGAVVFSSSLGVTGAQVNASTLDVNGTLTAAAGLVKGTIDNITPLDLTTTNGQAIANSRSVQYLVPSGALAITNTLANPAAKGDYKEVHNGFATNVFILDDANIEGQGSLTLGENHVVAYRAISATVWRELWRNTSN